MSEDDIQYIEDYGDYESGVFGFTKLIVDNIGPFGKLNRES
jgi:hypothetical protein